MVTDPKGPPRHSACAPKAPQGGTLPNRHAHTHTTVVGASTDFNLVVFLEIRRGRGEKIIRKKKKASYAPTHCPQAPPSPPSTGSAQPRRVPSPLPPHPQAAVVFRVWGNGGGVPAPLRCPRRPKCPRRKAPCWGHRGKHGEGAPLPQHSSLHHNHCGASEPGPRPPREPECLAGG